MAGAALRPVETMRRRAAEISASEPGARLPVPEAEDELRRLGETLNEMLARLEEALERERRFVDDASHELRTPLALHKTELELALLPRADEGELRAAIASATDEIDRLIALAEQLLVVARNEDGELRIEPEPFAAEDALAAIGARFAARAERAGRSLTYSAPPDSPPLRADRLRVEQALTNLVDNALVHGRRAGADGGAIERRPRRSSTSPTRGPGSPTSSSTTRSSASAAPTAPAADGGTGLGLAVVDAIARAHGGSAHARNRPGGGADVWIELPGLAGPDPLALRVEQRLGRDLARDPLAEDLDLDRGPGLGALRRQVGVGDRALDRVAVAAGGHPAGDLAADPHRLVAERDRARVGERQAAEPRPRPRLLGLDQRLAADEAALLVELHAEADPALVRASRRG